MHDVKTLSTLLTEARQADFALALKHHAADRFDEAEPIYQHLLASDPRDSR